MLGQPCCQNARHLLVWCHCLTTLSLCCQKKHFLSFWFGNWLASQTPNARWQGCLPSVSIVPAMQFAWATVYLWHEVSTSGWGLVGFQVFVAHSAFHQNDIKTNSFWNSSLSHAGNTVGAGPWFLPCPAGICEAHTINQHWQLPWIMQNMVCFCLYWLLDWHTPWQTPHHNFGMLAASAAAHLLDSVYTHLLATECQTSWC